MSLFDSLYPTHREIYIHVSLLQKQKPFWETVQQYYTNIYSYMNLCMYVDIYIYMYMYTHNHIYIAFSNIW